MYSLENKHASKGALSDSIEEPLLVNKMPKERWKSHGTAVYNLILKCYLMGLFT